MTTAEEFRFGKYRKEHNRDEVKQILLNFEKRVRQNTGGRAGVSQTGMPGSTYGPSKKTVGIYGGKPMKVVILAGGFGTRISEESHLKPKPMIEIGEKPIMWHIMKYYSQFGYNEFIICLGYKQYVVKEFFAGLLPSHI